MHGASTGADTFQLPEHMAIKFGRNTDFKALFLEIHYNNPEQATDAKDSSGFTALITTQPREHEYDFAPPRFPPNCSDVMCLHTEKTGFVSLLLSTLMRVCP